MEYDLWEDVIVRNGSYLSIVDTGTLPLFPFPSTLGHSFIPVTLRITIRAPSLLRTAAGAQAPAIRRREGVFHLRPVPCIPQTA